MLNLGESHWRRAFLVVVGHLVDSGADEVVPPQPGIAGRQQFGRRGCVPHPRIERQVIAARTESGYGKSCRPSVRIVGSALTE
jgi:hypothetical protein